MAVSGSGSARWGLGDVETDANTVPAMRMCERRDRRVGGGGASAPALAVRGEGG